MFKKSQPILGLELPNVFSEVLPQLPEHQNLKKAMRRVCQKNLPTNPKSVADLHDLPEEYQKILIDELLFFFLT